MGSSDQLEATCVRIEPRRNLPLETVWAARDGDDTAQRTLYESCVTATFGLVLRLVGRRDAEDVLQQVFLHVFSSLRQFSGESRFETWLFRVTTNECLQHLRRHRRKQLQSLEIDPMDPAPDHEQSGDDSELLEAALSRLDPELRSLFLLREKEQLSYRELAESLGISEGTVASRLNRARTLLKTYLEELGWGG